MDELPEYTLFSPAKVNIGLSIVGRRENGYHELQSVFWPLTLGDTIRVSQAKESSVTAKWDLAAPHSETLPQNADNIVGKLLARLPIEKKYRVEIKKKIPMGAGLGGGSSNAGTVLKFLVDRGEVSLSQAKGLAVSLGADVPFFLDPVPSWVTGIGEKIEKLSQTTNLHFLLVQIPEHRSTQEIFAQFKQTERPFSNPVSNPFLSPDASLDAWWKSAKNDLEPIVSEKSPITREVLTALRQTNALYAALSGSGSTCFGIYANSEDIEKAFKVLLPVCRKNDCRSITAKTHSGEQPWKSPKSKFSP